MRTTGPVADASGLGRHDHLCWAYSGAGELRSAVVTFLADGIAEGQRVAYAADGDPAALHEVVAGLPGCEELLARDALVLLPLGGVYDRGGELDPVRQVEVYAEATRSAVRDRFTGFRVAAEATPLVRDRRHRRTFSRYEQLVDRFMATEPLAAMCAYDTDLLAADELAEVSCVHPTVRGVHEPAFQLFATDRATASLRGDVDAFSAELFGRVVDDMPAEIVDIDARSARFIDHRALLVLDAAAARRALVVHGARPSLRRVAELLPTRHLELQP